MLRYEAARSYEQHVKEAWTPDTAPEIIIEWISQVRSIGAMNE